MNLEIVREKLIEDGFRVQGHQDGGLGFRFEGGNYFIDSDINDANYIRIGYPNFWTLPKDFSRLTALEFANKITESMKAAKLYLIDDGVYCTVEQFMPGPDSVVLVLPRCLGAIQSAARAFAEKMKTHAQQDQDGYPK